jgi:DNA ligase (NAD+)
MDGLSCKLVYQDGKLVSAATRGNGEIGEDVTHNAKVIYNIPQSIPNKGDTCIITGEVIVRENVFKAFANDFKNPRNFAAGAIRLLNSKEAAGRYLSFYAWDMPTATFDTYIDRLSYLQDIGFDIAPAVFVVPTREAIEQHINDIRGTCTNDGLPIDGIVARYNDIAYGNSLGETAHHPRHSFAFKFKDEIVETTLKDIIYEPSRNGLMTPVAIFEPVDLLGSTIEKASLYNRTMMDQILTKHPWRGQKLGVIKSNMIIPQIVWAEHEEELEDDGWAERYIIPPITCPVCGTMLSVTTSDSGVESLYCTNPQCNCRLINRLDYFCGKSGFDIKGLSKATLEKLIEWGWVNNLVDIFNLTQYRDEWIKKSGFGAKSVDKILSAIEESKNIDLAHFIAAFGITGIGLNVAKELCKHISTLDEFYQIMDGTIDCTEWEGFGRAKRNAIMCADVHEIDEVNRVVAIAINLVSTTTTKNNDLTVVITGRLAFGSRPKFKEYLEQNGVKVIDSVSSKTNYLIANKPETSAKYKKAQKLNIPIVTEDEFLEIIKK